MNKGCQGQALLSMLKQYPFCGYQKLVCRVIAKSNFRKGGANLPVCRNARQGVAHLFGNYFWQSV
jgi:hypothetical protein